ncbi:hypothetical protein Ilyop_2806 (plasmid) [Ilyobacter polytropus DSM 2926]|uniref:Uncharacterized protein n=1 Tax=Ilyobacter polytropus (strain ATCC 51220 / DSM 2926 / LMG 16218 / CuHBu1) TaxID=572544 RepID=E3HDF7_ILYPC|nr:hypothetical protein Ilyop_2806 [Ilyobacter polytropus DSM 2926]
MKKSLNKSEIDLLIDKSIDKIPFEMRKIKFILFVVKIVNKHKIKKDHFIKIVLFFYIIYTLYYFFIK